MAQVAVGAQQQAAAEREAQERKVTEVSDGDAVVYMLWPVPEGDIVNWQLLTGDGEHIDELPGDDVAQVQQWAARVLDEMGFVATQWREKRDEESATTFYVIDFEEADGYATEPDPAGDEADGEPDASEAGGAIDGGGEGDGEPVFALFAVDDGDRPRWWLTDDDFGASIGELDAGPDEVDKAQEWASDLSAMMTLPVAGWRLVRGADQAPDHYRAVWADEEDQDVELGADRADEPA